MGLFKTVEEKKAKALQHLAPMLLEGENIETVEILSADFVAFTNLRLICRDYDFGDKQDLLTSIPYSKITSVGVCKGTGLGASFLPKVHINVGGSKIVLTCINSSDAPTLVKAIFTKMMQH